MLIIFIFYLSSFFCVFVFVQQIKRPDDKINPNHLHICVTCFGALLLIKKDMSCLSLFTFFTFVFPRTGCTCASLYSHPALPAAPLGDAELLHLLVPRGYTPHYPHGGP